MVSRTHFSMLNTGRCQHLLFGMGLPLEGKLDAKARGFDTAVSKVRTSDFGRMMDRAGQDSFGLHIAEPNVAHTCAEARLLLFVLLFGFVLLFQTCGRSSAIPYLRRLTLLVPVPIELVVQVHRSTECYLASPALLDQTLCTRQTLSPVVKTVSAHTHEHVLVLGPPLRPPCIPRAMSTRCKKPRHTTSSDVDARLRALLGHPGVWVPLLERRPH